MKGRITAVASLSVMAVALAGCSTAEPQADGETTIRVIRSIEPDMTPYTDQIQRFEDANPGITVDFEQVSKDQYESVLRTQLSSGNAPDVFATLPGLTGLIAVGTLSDAGFLADLSGAPWEEQIPQAIDQGVRVDDALYQLPTGSTGMVALYNPALLSEIGAEVPTTWTEVLDLCRTASDAGFSAFALGAQTQSNTQFIPYALIASTVYSADPDFNEQQADGDVTFAGSGWRDAFEKFLEMQDEGCFNDGALGTPSAAALDLLASGQAVATVTGAQAAPALEETTPGLELASFALPGTDDPARNWFAGGLTPGWSANANSDVLDAAKSYIDFLGSPEELATMAAATGLAPALTGVDYEPTPVTGPIVEAFAEDRVALFPDPYWPNADVQAAHIAGVQELLSGQASVDDVLARMDEAYARG